MNCERCGQRPARVKYIEVEEGEKRSRWLCEVCAAEEGARVTPPPDNPAPEELSLFMGAEDNLDAAASPQPPRTCPHCGTAFAALEDDGLLGCTRCYEVFREGLRPVLHRFHRAAVHVGKAPRARGPVAQRRVRLNELRRRLDAAVAAEDYEQAARLRDEIEAFQTQEDRS